MLLHLSDLHFGTVQLDRLLALQDFCLQHQPELVVVSGDLTQRARYREFLACKQFLEGLKLPYLVVPGNHDIPLYQLWRRFTSPFQRFEFFFGEAEQALSTAHFYVLGVNSIRPKHHTKGSISRAQIEGVRQALQQAPAGLLKFVAVHQPFYTEPDDKHKNDCPMLGAVALKQWAEVGLVGLLHGHLHQSAVYDLKTFYDLPIQHSVLDIHAGTALSSRLHHGANNGFNCIYPNGEIEGYEFSEMQRKFILKQKLWCNR